MDIDINVTAWDCERQVDLMGKGRGRRGRRYRRKRCWAAAEVLTQGCAPRGSVSAKAASTVRRNALDSTSRSFTNRMKVGFLLECVELEM